MAVETNARIEFSVSSVEEWERVNPKLHQGEPVFAKKPSGKYILKVGAPGGSTYKNAVVVWDQDDAETKMENTQTAAAESLASKNAAASSASAAKTSETAAAASKSAAATSEANAKTSETNAASSKTSAANSASTASTKATSAGNSASAAAASEKNAASSASACATSESNALKSANAASTSAGNARTSETNAAASANVAKAWSMSDSSPDGVTGNKSSKTWAEEAKTSAGNASASASASQSSANASSASATQSANSASASKSSANASASSASAASSSASAASTSATNAKASETNAANSAKAAKASADRAASFDPSSYYSKTEVDAKYMKKTADSDLNMGTNKISFPRITVYGQYINGIPTLQINAKGTRGVFVTGPLILNGLSVATQDYVNDRIPTKVSQLSDDVGIAKISNGHLVINGSELWVE